MNHSTAKAHETFMVSVFMHSLLEGAKAAAVVKHSWQSLGLGDTLGLGFWIYTRKQGAGFLRRSSKLTFSLVLFVAVAGQSWKHLSPSKFSWSQIHIFSCLVETKQVNMQGKVPLSLYWIFLEGYIRVSPESEESSPSSSPFPGGRRFCCSQLESWGCCAKVLLWTGRVRTDGTGISHRWVGEADAGWRELCVEVTKAKFGWCLLPAEEAGGDLLTKHQAMGQKGQDIIFPFPQLAANCPAWYQGFQRWEHLETFWWIFLFWLAWGMCLFSSFLLSVVLKSCRAWLRRNETDLRCWDFFMVVCLWSNNFGQSGCQHLALAIMCLCVKSAAFLGKEEWENQELLRRTTKPATSVMRSLCLRVMWFLGKVLATGYFSAYAEMGFGSCQWLIKIHPLLHKARAYQIPEWDHDMWWGSVHVCSCWSRDPTFRALRLSDFLKDTAVVCSSSEGRSHSG